MKKRTFKILDLFAGSGGFSEGFLATGKCEIVGHIEMDKSACDTIVTRMIFHALKKKKKLYEYEKYLSEKISKEELIKKYSLQREKGSVINIEITKENYRKLIKQIKKQLGRKKLDVIIGGPPCQAYSYIGRARDKNRMKDDKRNYLYELYIDFLKALKPKVFVFENVPGLLTAGSGEYLTKMRELMKKAGYATDYRIVNAADYGVPQNRRRIILVGWNEKSSLKEYPQFKTVERDYKVKDFLRDLPLLKAGQGSTVMKYAKKSPLLVKLGIINQNINILTDHFCRSHAYRDLKIYKIAALAKKDGKSIKYNELPANLKTHHNVKSFLDRFKVVDFSATACHTVVAHICKDGHYYIHPDEKQNRSLSVREAARLQTFPDDYKFEGSYTSQFKQIGNAVPPMLAKLIASTILKNI